MTATSPVVLDLPFRGRWRTENSPARRVPSHGTDLFGVTWAIDFVAVDDLGRSAPRTWRSLVSTEAPEAFHGFGVPILAPIGGTVVETRDGVPDHLARRSQPALAAYALTQAQRVRAGVDAIAGNRVVIDLGPGGPFVLLAHLRRGSVRVQPGDRVAVADQLGECGNSGNSTEPHVHVQVTDSRPHRTARGLPLAFRRPDGSSWVPAESEVVLA